MYAATMQSLEDGMQNRKAIRAIVRTAGEGRRFYKGEEARKQGKCAIRAMNARFTFHVSRFTFYGS